VWRPEWLVEYVRVRADFGGCSARFAADRVGEK
jgi:hypothetical protein